MKAARYGCAWALALVALGCRDDIVLTLPLDPVPEQTVEKSFVGRTGADYVLWSDYNLDTPASKAGARFCYEIVVDVVQEGAVVATTSCGPFPHSGTCMYTRKSSRFMKGDCATNCEFELANEGPTSLRAHLVREEPCDRLWEGLVDPASQIVKLDLLLEEDD